MYTAVQDNVDISLVEVKEWLRLTDVLVGKVTVATLANATAVTLDSVEMINKNMYLTIDDESYLISSINYGSKVVTVASLIVEVVSVGTPVYIHPHDRMLMRMILETKSFCDEYLNNPFILGVPPEVKSWILKKIALDYDRPEASVSRVELDNRSGKTFLGNLYEDIDHLRMYPL